MFGKTVTDYVLEQPAPQQARETLDVLALSPPPPDVPGPELVTMADDTSKRYAVAYDAAIRTPAYVEAKKKWLDSGVKDASGGREMLGEILLDEIVKFDPTLQPTITEVHENAAAFEATQKKEVQ